jgi:hypothetical protein
VHVHPFRRADAGRSRRRPRRRRPGDDQFTGGSPRRARQMMIAHNATVTRAVTSSTDPFEPGTTRRTGVPAVAGEGGTGGVVTGVASVLTGVSPWTAALLWSCAERRQRRLIPRSKGDPDKGSPRSRCCGARTRDLESAGSRSVTVVTPSAPRHSVKCPHPRSKMGLIGHFRRGRTGNHLAFRISFRKTASPGWRSWYFAALILPLACVNIRFRSIGGVRREEEQPLPLTLGSAPAHCAALGRA